MPLGACICDDFCYYSAIIAKRAPMNLNMIFGGVIAVLLIILGLSFFGKNSPSPAATSTDVTNTPASATGTTPIIEVTPQKPSTIKGGSTYTSLLTQEGNYQCDYTQVQKTGQSRNVIYLSDGKMRAEFRTSSGPTSASNLSLYDGKYLYVWTEGKTTGTRTSITSLGQLPSAIPKDLTSGNILGTNTDSVGWKCHAWLVNKALLVPPSYVHFQ